MPNLRDNQIAIYVVELSQAPSHLEKKLSFLSPDECERAKRFKFDYLYRRYVICRAKLREILGQYLDVDPASIHFSYTEYGKPYLTETNAKEQPLSFNVSHSEDIAVMAFSWGHELGIDVENIRSISHIDGIAERYFSEDELEPYRTAPLDKKAMIFFDSWTRREALTKAKGLGISAITGDINTDEWSFYRFIPRPGFVATLAYPNEDIEISMIKMPLDPLP
jgi:4'-phosphopantetheinyl transferase